MPSTRPPAPRARRAATASADQGGDLAGGGCVDVAARAAGRGERPAERLVQVGPGRVQAGEQVADGGDREPADLDEGPDQP